MTTALQPGAAVPSRAARFAREHWLEFATVLVALSVYAATDLQWVNVDEYTAHAFRVDFGAAYSKMVSGDASSGRFRPLYWLFTGFAGAAGGPSATFLIWFRLLFLGANVWLQLRIALRLGAPPWAASLLSLAAAWSLPALAVWPHGGPAEAFANPLALACTLLILRADDTRAVLVAAAAGLAAGLVKESSGAWTATALAAFALHRWLGGRRGRAAAAAFVGAAVQLLPSVAATLAAGAWGSSYVAHVATALSAPAAVTARFALEQELLPVLLAAVSLPFVVAPLLHRLRDWPFEDLLLLALLCSTLLLTFAFGFVMPRYHLPLVTSALLLAARASRRLAGAPRARWLAWGVAASLAVADAAGGARALVETRSLHGGRGVHGRLRTQLREALERYGSARLYWVPDQVEVAVGAIEHLRAEGLRAPVELVPCFPPDPASAGLLLSIFRDYSVPVPRWTIALAHYQCGGAPVSSRYEECHLRLPGIAGLRLRRECSPVPEFAAVVYAP